MLDLLHRWPRFFNGYPEPCAVASVLTTTGEGNVQILHPFGPDQLAGAIEIVPGVSRGAFLRDSVYATG